MRRTEKNDLKEFSLHHEVRRHGEAEWGQASWEILTTVTAHIHTSWGENVIWPGVAES